MIKKVIIGFVFSLFLTVVFWQVTARLSLGRELDNIAFLASPILAIIVSAVSYTHLTLPTILRV